MHEEQKKVMQKEMDRLEHLGIIQKGLIGYSSPVVLIRCKIPNLHWVYIDFHILNEKMVKINHAFPLVRDCIEQLGRKCCHYLSTIDLRDALISSFISKILQNPTLLWITSIPLPLDGYGYEHESTHLAMICRSCIPSWID